MIYGGGGAIGGAVARAFAREERRSSLPGAVGFLHVQGTPFAELSFLDYAHPITA